MSDTSHPSPVRPAGSSAGRLHLDFLDGIRGLAALYVAVYHCALFTGTSGTEFASPLARAVTAGISFGHYSVAVFIVLSGFVLGLPVARHTEVALPKGFGNYIRRRARRILPPYYVALFLYALLILALPVMSTPADTAWDSKLPMTAGSFVSHLFLVHAIRGDWIFKIDGPMWSVATEWWIYFLFPGILIPLWRRAGIGPAVLVCVALGLLVPFVKHVKGPYDLALCHPWYFGLFALGVAGAAVAAGPAEIYGAFRQRIPWRLAAALAVGIAAIAVIGRHAWMEEHAHISETLVGLATVIVIVYYITSQTWPRRSRSVRLFSSRPAVILGGFSYSLYLVHSPILGLFNLLTLRLPLTPDARLCLMMLVALPLAIALSYVFYLLVERHFLSGHQREQAARTS